MFDFEENETTTPSAFETIKPIVYSKSKRRLFYKNFKRVFDIGMSILLLPVLLLTAAGLLVLNPVINRGSVLFVQQRMGQGCRPFRAFKFRSMVEVEAIERGPFDALEHHRITSLGRLLRKSRLDELPQIINVLRGEMSLIGPRPDYLDHARVFVETVPGYRERHAVLPGISGYAQVAHGYIEGHDGLRNKVAADLHYIRHGSVAFDLWIAWRTFVVVILRYGK